MKQKKTWQNLHRNMVSLDYVYNSTIYGAKHKEASTVKLLSKFDSKYVKKSFKSKKLKEALKEINAIEKTKNKKRFKIKFNKEEKKIIRRAILWNLNLQKRIPSMALNQTIISLTSLFETFISDSLKSIYCYNINTLKSNSFTLKDKDIIEAVSNKNIIDKLIELKIKKLLFEDFKEWITYMNNTFGFNLEVDKGIIKLFLIRNCLVHNDCKVSEELSKFSKDFKFKKKIRISKKDYREYFESVHKYSRYITYEIVNKFENKKLNKNFLSGSFFRKRG